MSGSQESGHARLVRERFTRTANVFADFALGQRAGESRQLIDLIEPQKHECALDVACGPGTLARWLAPRVRWVIGLDMTVAMLERAAQTAQDAGLVNLQCVCADAAALPFADSSPDIGVAGFCLHHIGDPGAVLRELGRVIRRRGRVGILDLVVPQNAARAEAHNRIERLRDASHTRTLSAAEIAGLVESSGFRLCVQETTERPRDFDHWMHVAGWKRGDTVYEEVRRLVADSMEDDSAAFAPRVVSSGDESRLEIKQTATLIVGERC